MSSRNRVGRSFRCLFVVGVCVCSLQAPVQGQSPCDKYTVGFFNGIWNTQDDALSGLAAIRSLTMEVHSEKNVDYRLFYNPSESRLQDIARIFVQRADAFAQSDLLRRRFELLWELISDGYGESWERLVLVAPAVFGTMRDTLVAQLITTVARAVPGSTTEPVVEKHIRLLADFARDHSGVLLIAHSQGNFFASPVFERSETRFGVNGIKLVHVAPPSTPLLGEYHLATIDLVIDSLRSVPGGAVPRSNLQMRASPLDWSGHLLVETYLDRNRRGRTAIARSVGSAFDSMEGRC